MIDASPRVDASRLKSCFCGSSASAVLHLRPLHFYVYLQTETFHDGDDSLIVQATSYLRCSASRPSEEAPPLCTLEGEAHPHNSTSGSQRANPERALWQQGPIEFNCELYEIYGDCKEDDHGYLLNRATSPVIGFEPDI